MTATTNAGTGNTAQAGRPDIEVGAGRLFIGGQWVDSRTDDRREVVDPSTGTSVTTVAEAGADDAEAATGAARRAFDEGPWAAMGARERGRVLLRAAELLRGRAEEFARLESLDTGKPIVFSRTVDIATSAEMIEYYGSLAAGIEGAVRSTAAPMMAYTRREALGVVAAITPFNFPLILSTAKIGPALAAGNTVVHKPAEETPLTALRLAEVLQEAGVPDGVFNVVTGGAPAGDALVNDPKVDKVAFTGSTAVGRSIAAAAARTLKHVTVELGGKGANIIFADADIEAAVRTAIGGIVFNTGQFCMAGSRVLVERPVYEDVVKALGESVQYVPVGDPFDEGTVVGPMAGSRHRDKVRSFLSRAQADGLRILGGTSAPEGSSGFYVSPTVLADVEQSSAYVQEEIFGPVLTVQPFDTDDEAVRLANDTQFGLAAGLQTSDVTRAHRVAARLRAGLVWVNTWGVLDVAVPFGGVKQSGYGRECGPEGLDEYLQTKSVLISMA
ncbi:aldehyde dehydrogenase family protein [Streptomyces phaeochromogenes]|uniref:aldehyde dehydrogenase family protein n=1 Tax=Streptomyces phaeochromogenes TaxID=1923 RepID=UPI002DDB5B95|nr:aldehyde dehydrogenase family protein [Streptomyces phaeochromogenes]WRZ34636.1 aldehyde dehydrogenase family protein [Streptomyces phaeochromogenes]